jgi:hypothetical protein
VGLSAKLLLALARTVILEFILEWCLLFNERRGLAITVQSPSTGVTQSGTH